MGVGMNSSKMILGLAAGWLLLWMAGLAGAQDWPQWRGPNRDNKVTGFTEPKEWPKELTKKWKTKVGEGDATPALVGDKIYAFGRQGGEEVVVCLDADNGNEVWSDKYKAPEARVPGGGHIGPRACPTVADGKVCTFGVSGVLTCYDAAKGTNLWRKETKDVPGFWASASPLITDGKCIAQIGKSPSKIIAYDLANGEEKWTWSGGETAYGSPVLMTVEKTNMIVAPTKSSIVGINAADGKELWKISFSGQYNSATPFVDGQTVFYSAPGGGFGGGRGSGGTVAYKIEKKDDAFEAKKIWTKSDCSGIYNTPVLKDGQIYGLSGGNRAAAYFYCMNAETGEKLWSDKTERGECAAILDAGSVLIGLSSDKQLVVFKPNKEKYEEVAKYKVADSATWASPIVSGNRIIVKDRDSIILWTIEADK